MVQFPSNPFKAPSHFALVDSGASIHILTCHTFLSDASINHSAVASFAGSTSRATHKGTFAALVQCTNNKFHRLVQKDSALVVPDASRMLFSISQALLAGHHVHFGNSPGLLGSHRTSTRSTTRRRYPTTLRQESYRVRTYLPTQGRLVQGSAVRSILHNLSSTRPTPRQPRPSKFTW
jgi:hypothetical protein